MMKQLTLRLKNLLIKAMYSYLADDNGEHKKTKGAYRNVVATVSHNEYKDVLLNKKCLTHSMSRIQCEDHRIGTYEINKISLSCFDEKWCGGLALVIRVNYKNQLS